MKKVMIAFLVLLATTAYAEGSGDPAPAPPTPTTANFLLACDGVAHVEGAKGLSKLKVKTVDKESTATTKEDDYGVLIDLNQLKTPEKDPAEAANHDYMIKLMEQNMQIVEFEPEGSGDKWSIDLRVVPDFDYDKQSGVATLTTLRMNGGLVKNKTIALRKRALATSSTLKNIYDILAGTTFAAVDPNYTQLTLYPQHGLDMVMLTCAVK